MSSSGWSELIGTEAVELGFTARVKQVNKLNGSSGGPEWHYPPLCRSYLLALFGDFIVRAHEDRGPQFLHFRWAIGVLADGQFEMLGVWRDLAPDDASWRKVSVDLKCRGVEKIRFVASIDLDTELAMLPSYPSSMWLTSIGQFLRRVAAGLKERHRGAVDELGVELHAAGTIQRARTVVADFAAGPVGLRYPGSLERWSPLLEQLEAIYALRPRLRRLIRNADNVAQEVRRRLSRAIARHGCSASLSTATSFVAETLTHDVSDFGVLKPAHAAGSAQRRARTMTGPVAAASRS